MRKYLFLSILTLFLLLPSCKSKETICEQAYYNLMEYGVIDNGSFENDQGHCIKEFDKQESFWKCVARADNKKELEGCARLRKKIKQKFD